MLLRFEQRSRTTAERDREREQGQPVRLERIMEVLGQRDSDQAWMPALRIAARTRS
jgi:hypothetical protein